MTRFTFQTRARTIDHLGRGQIADCPTAVSELWKNAYDAYAKKVSLHIFDGDQKVAAVMDDGIGMTQEDFLERWLVVGTESKVRDDAGPPEIPAGMEERPKQGEKGIGRLSAAFLAPVSLIVSKKVGHPFAAVLVDWRLFENPYLSLEDVEVAVETFDEPQDLLPLLPSMFDVLLRSLGHGEMEAGRRLSPAWARYDSQEREAGLSPTTSERIRATADTVRINERHLQEWPVYNGLSSHGTALLLLDVHRELALHVESSGADEDPEVVAVKEDLRRTLTGFTDPYAEVRETFDYEAVAHIGRRRHDIIRAEDVFGVEDFQSLEHSLEGAFDEHGVFRGRLRVFGIDRGIITHVPRRPPPRSGRDRLGPFYFCVGTFDQVAVLSTHVPAVHSALSEKAERYGGIFVYRDHLRVMPYGNPESDLFGVEERRSRHAGRYFWAHRRSFGRVAFTRFENSNLRDKAGREGLVDNRAFRELQALVIDLLVSVGRRYFGTDSDIRKNELPEIEARNMAARESAAKAKKARTKTMRTFLRAHAPVLDECFEEIVEIKSSLEAARAAGDSAEANAVSERVEGLRRKRLELRLPPMPARLGDWESDYRVFRDRFKELTAALDALGTSVAKTIEELGSEPSEVVAEKRLQSNQSRLNATVDKYRKTIEGQLNELRDSWKSQASEDFKVYYQRATPLLGDLERGVRLGTLLNSLDALAAELEETFAERYEPFLRALEQLRNNIDLEGALAVTEDERAQLDKRVNDFNTLAQLGIAMEIIGHELETMDQEVGRNLNRLSADVRKSEAFKLAYEAHRALADRLRFLAPLRLAGYRSRETITGAQIADFVTEFFSRRIRDERVVFDATEAFRSIKITDLRSRILPVFINLLNNALYWVRFVEDRRIRLDRVGELVVVADSGTGIDEDDLPNLFELFFTRRTNGRGVGLHLCRLNLAVAHHTIRYATGGDPQVLPGANFIIEFRGMVHD